MDKKLVIKFIQYLLDNGRLSYLFTNAKHVSDVDIHDDDGKNLVFEHVIAEDIPPLTF